MAWCFVRLVGAEGLAAKTGMSGAAAPAASRTPPSVITPSAPRASSRVSRIEPAEASQRQSIASAWPSGQVSTATRWG